MIRPVLNVMFSDSKKSLGNERKGSPDRSPPKRETEYAKNHASHDIYKSVNNIFSVQIALVEFSVPAPLLVLPDLLQCTRSNNKKKWKKKLDLSPYGGAKVHGAQFSSDSLTVNQAFLVLIGMTTESFGGTTKCRNRTFLKVFLFDMVHWNLPSYSTCDFTCDYLSRVLSFFCIQ